MITIVHTGQTGVERGADRAARAVGFSVRGFCQRDSRDEFGAIPSHIACDLTPVGTRGARIVWGPSLELVDVLVIVVPDAATPNTTPGIGALRTLARSAHVQQFVVDAVTEWEEFARRLWALDKPTADLAIMVCGPRKTRWIGGEQMGWQAVTNLWLAASAVPSTLDPNEIALA